MDLGQSGQPLGNVYANYFCGDGSGLYNVGGGTDVSAWGTPDISDNGPVFGNTSERYFDSGGVANFASVAMSPGSIGFNDFFANHGPDDIGGGYQCLINNLYVNSAVNAGEVYAGYFYGDGSGLTNVSGSPDMSSYRGDIGNSGTPAGYIYASGFYGDGGNLWNINAENCEYAGAPLSNFNGFFGWMMPGMDLGDSSSNILGNIYATAFYGDGSNLTGVSADLTSYTGNIGGVWSPVGNIYTTCIGDSDHWIPNVFSENIEAGTIHADEYFVCYTGMSLPSPAPCGTICYSRHAGGHFYGMTDDGWKQLDS